MNANIDVKKNIIYNAVMSGWKVKKLKKDKIEISKSKKHIGEHIDEHLILNKLISNN
jgi:hypothetical protein